MFRLPAVALLLHQADAAVEHVVVALPLPAVLQVPLAHVGLVQEAVVVDVVVAELVLVVSQHLGTQLAVQMDVGIGVGLYAASAVAVKVHRHALVGVGFQVLHVYLAGNALVAVAHRRGPLRHLDAVHPGAWHVIEGEGRGCSPEVGQVLCEHLNVRAAQSQQLDLLGTRRCVAVVHVDRRVRGKALAQVTAGSLEQLLAPYQHSVGRASHTARPGTP